MYSVNVVIMHIDKRCRDKVSTCPNRIGKTFLQVASFITRKLPTMQVQNDLTYNIFLFLARRMLGRKRRFSGECEWFK